MATARIVRKSFNGGEIAPELHFRSDLEAYHNSCKSLKNMMVTPWGAATRRPPTKLLSKIDTAVYGVPVKYIPFRFSLSETFHIVFTDDTGSEGTAGFANLIVFDEDGTQQVLFGEDTDRLLTVYDPADLGDLHFIQANDFIYMTCGGNYPVQALVRYVDEGEGENRWRMEEWEMAPQPMQAPNTDESQILNVQISGVYDNEETYQTGDTVRAGTASGSIIESINLKYWYGWRGWPIFGVHLYTNEALNVAVGDTVQLKDVSISALPEPFTSEEYDLVPITGDTVHWRWHHGHHAVNVGDSMDGSYTVAHVHSQTHVLLNFEVSLWVSNDNGNIPVSVFTAAPQPTIDMSGSSGGASGTPGAYYQSVQDDNIGKALDNEDWWKIVDYYQGSVNIDANWGAFRAGDVGRHVSLEVDVDNKLSGSWNANTTSKAINAQGTVILTTEGGAWEGLLELQESRNGGITWDSIGSIRSLNGSTNSSIEREISGVSSILRVRLTEWAAPTATYDVKRCIWRLQFLTPVRVFFRITDYTDERNVVARTLSPLFKDFADYRWQLGEFSDRTGHPNTLTIHDERMVFGGSKAKPNTVWASRVNDWGNFLEGDLETSPYTFTVKSDSFDTIRWMRSARQLMIGTENSESTMGTRDNASVISPTNINVETQTYFGSGNIQAVVTADLIFFVQGQRQRVRSTQYDFGTDQYLSSEMSIMAHHITSPGIKEMSFRRHPYSSIFFVLDDGKAVSFTYERESFVKGWSRFEMGGSAIIVSAASNYSETGDIVAGVVKRGADYYLEMFSTNEAGTVFLDSQVQFVDQNYSAGVAVPYGSASGLTVVRNDVELAPAAYTITAGVLTIPDVTDGTVTVGYKFPFEVQPTDIIELGDHGIPKRVSSLSLYLLHSGGCAVAINGDVAPFQASANLAPGAVLNGEYELSVGGGTESAIKVKLSGDHHRAFNIAAFGVYGQASR